MMNIKLCKFFVAAGTVVGVVAALTYGSSAAAFTLEARQSHGPGQLIRVVDGENRAPEVWVDSAGDPQSIQQKREEKETVRTQRETTADDSNREKNRQLDQKQPPNRSGAVVPEDSSPNASFQQD
jgi:hypothetical protein